jgi:hypothetical protein
MRWFSAFWVTTALAMIFAGLLALRNGHIPYLSPALEWAIPITALTPTLQLLLLFGTWIVVRMIMQRILAYTESAVDSSPRGPAGIRASIGAASYRLFSNPARWWITPYAVILGITVAASWPLVALGQFPPLAWGLSALYFATLVSAMIAPDRLQSLRTTEDPEPDPVLKLPTEGIAAGTPE